MKRSLLSLLPAAGMFAGSALALALLSASPTALAQACKTDVDGSCKSPGKACNPPAGGKCKTSRGVQEFLCNCVVPKPKGSRGETDGPPRSERPNRGEPMEQPEEEPQEEQPEG